ncbi:B12 binding domain protein [uncultured archaeon]|nr:B12 binding domain protein [uncultured archaeon]
MPKKILFLKARTGVDDPSPPMAFSLLGEIAKEEGFEVTIENLNAQYNNKKNEDIIELIKRENPEIVGVHVFTNAARYSYELIKKIRPYAKLIIAGGPHPTVCPEEILERGADIAVIGEAEISFRRLLRALYAKKNLKKVKGIVFKEKGKITRTEPEEVIFDLDKIPMPDKSFNRKTDYIKVKKEVNNFGQILSTRGCPGRCTYCFSLFSKCYRCVSAKRVFEEMIYLKKTYEIDFINFIDDAFTINKKRLFELCELLVKNNTHIRWSCGTRIDFLDREMISKMKEAGCELIILGVESCLPKTLLGMNKIIKVNGITNQQEYIKRVDEILKWCREFKIRVGVNILCGFPWEIPQDMKKMQRYIQRIKRNVTQGFYGGILQPQPGTDMYEKYAKEYGFEKWWIDKKPLFKDNYRPFFTIYYHQYWEHLHNNFFKFSKEYFKEIDKLYKIMGRWNLYIFTKRRFKNFLSISFIYSAFYLTSLFSMYLYKISPSLERKLMEKIKKFSYTFKFKKS